MFGFSLSEEQRIMQDTIKTFVKDVILETAHDMDEEGNIDSAFLQKAWEMGISVSPIPEEYGGYGMESSPVMNAIILEELAAGDMAFAVAATAPSMFIIPVLQMGTDAQKKKYLPLACSETYKPLTLAMTEPHFGFDPVELKTTAEKKGGAYTLNGEKCFVPLADESSHMLVSADCGGSNGLFIVSRDNPGLKMGDRERNMGLYALKTYELKLENCEIPAEDRLGGEEGMDYDRFLQKCRTGMAAMAAGVSKASYEYAREYVKERVQFGEPISHRQAVAFMVAEMAYETDALQLMAWKAASMLESGKDARREAYLARFFAVDTAIKITDYGVQLLGGHGFIRDHPVERYCRNGRGFANIDAMAIV